MTLLDTLRENGLPQCFDRSYFGNSSGGMVAQPRRSLKFLGLIGWWNGSPAQDLLNRIEGAIGIAKGGAADSSWCPAAGSSSEHSDG